MPQTETYKTVLVWCFVCKAWKSTVPNVETCPTCGNDEIEHDE